MKWSWPRYTLRELALAIAILAVAFAFFGVEVTVVIFVLCLPAVFASRGRRIASLYWVAACYPVIALLSLYVTWLTAWYALGHPPRSSLDDPKDIRAIQIPYMTTAILLVGTFPALFAAIVLTFERIIRGIMTKEKGTSWKADDLSSAFGWGIGPLLWVGAYHCFRLDPLSVFYWYMD